MQPAAIQYAATELRYGVEFLLFELLVLSGKVMSHRDYRDCLGNAFKDNKAKLSNAGANYEKLAKFTNRVLTRNSGVRLTEWNLAKLAAAQGVASAYLHFCGTHKRTYEDEQWVIAAYAKLGEALKYPLEEKT